MLKINQIVICGLSILFFTGCVTYKADSTSISTPDYNQRVDVSGAHYDNVITPIGVTSIAASTIGGGYFAYQTNLIKYNSGAQQKTSPFGNAIIGAAIGFGTSYAINKLLGWGNTKNVTDRSEWVRKANNEFKLLNTYQFDSNFRVINSKAENNYQVKDLNDVKDFKYVFPTSSYSDNVVKQSIPVVSRSQLLELIDLYPANSYLIPIKKEFIIRSTTLTDLLAAEKRFSDVNISIENNGIMLVNSLDDAVNFILRFPNSNSKDNIESKAANYVSSISDCRKFNNNFPRSSRIDDIVKKLYKTLSRSDLILLIELYPSSSQINNAKLEYIRTSSDLDAFFAAIQKYPNNYINIQPVDYKDGSNSKRLFTLYNEILDIKSILGEQSFNRFASIIRKSSLDYGFSKLNSYSAYKIFVEKMPQFDYLYPELQSYIDKAQKYIDDVDRAEASNRAAYQKQQEEEKAELQRVEDLENIEEGDMIIYTKQYTYERNMGFLSGGKKTFIFTMTVKCYVEANIDNGEKIRIKVASITSDDEYDHFEFPEINGIIMDFRTIHYISKSHYENDTKWRKY